MEYFLLINVERNLVQLYPVKPVPSEKTTKAGTAAARRAILKDYGPDALNLFRFTITIRPIRVMGDRYVLIFYKRDTRGL